MTAQVEFFGKTGGASDTTVLRVLGEYACARMACQDADWPRRLESLARVPVVRWMPW